MISDIFGIDPYIFGGGLSAVAGGALLFNSFKEENERDWLTYGDAKNKHKLVGHERGGIILGYHANGKLLSDGSRKHVFLDGPTESGKSLNSVLWTLLLNIRYGIMISDQKGDMWRLTSGIRSTYGPLFRLDPSYHYTSTYNPLNDILYSDNMYAELQRFFKTLIIGDGPSKSKDPHWEQKAIEIAPAVAMHLLLGDDASKKNIGSVLRFIRRGVEAFEEMRDQARDPVCVAIASSMINDLPERGSPYRNNVINGITAPLSLWNDVNVDRMTSSSSFLMDDLMTSERPITVYMTAPGSDIERLLPLYRAIRDMSKSHLLYRSNVTLRGNKKIRPLLQIVDECQNETPPGLDKRLEVCRSYGERWLCGWQSLEAAEAKYGKHLLGLAKIKLSYRPTVGDPVVKRLSAMSGYYMKKEVSETQHRQHGFWITDSRRIEEKETLRMHEWDFEQLPEFGRAMLTHPGKPAILNMTDGEHDPNFIKYILPEYVMQPPEPIISPWAISLPKPVEAPADKEGTIFIDDYASRNKLIEDDDDGVIV